MVRNGKKKIKVKNSRFDDSAEKNQKHIDMDKEKYKGRKPKKDEC